MDTHRNHNLPNPNSRETYSTWIIDHHIRNSRDQDIDGWSVILSHRFKTINVMIDDHEHLTLDREAAYTFALSLLAAVEEANTRQENQ